MHHKNGNLEAMSLAENYHRWILTHFEPFLGTRVAEVGAGLGNFSSFLLKSNIQELTAIEPSKELYPLLAQKFCNDKRVLCRQAKIGRAHV